MPTLDEIVDRYAPDEPRGRSLATIVGEYAPFKPDRTVEQIPPVEQTPDDLRRAVIEGLPASWYQVPGEVPLEALKGAVGTTGTMLRGSGQALEEAPGTLIELSPLGRFKRLLDPDVRKFAEDAYRHAVARPAAGMKIAGGALEAAASEEQLPTPELPAVPKTVLRGVGSVAPGIGAALAGGPAGIAAFGGAVQYGDTFKQVKDLGGTDREARLFALASGVVGAVTEPLMGVERSAVNVLSKADDLSKGWLFKQLLKASAGEGGEEVIEEIPNEVARQAYVADRTFWDSMVQLGATGLLGGTVGLIVQGMVSAPAFVRAVRADRAKRGLAVEEVPPPEPGSAAPAVAGETQAPSVAPEKGEIAVGPPSVPVVPRETEVQQTLEKLSALAGKETVSRREWSEATGRPEREAPNAAGRVEAARAAAESLAQEKTDASRQVSDVREPEGRGGLEGEGRQDYQRGRQAGPTVAPEEEAPAKVAPPSEPQPDLESQLDALIAAEREAGSQVKATRRRGKSPLKVAERELAEFAKQNAELFGDEAALEAAARTAAGLDALSESGEPIARSGYVVADNSESRSWAREVRNLLPKELQSKVKIVKPGDPLAVSTKGVDLISPEGAADAIKFFATRTGKGLERANAQTAADFIFANPDLFPVGSDAWYKAQRYQVAKSVQGDKAAERTISTKPSEEVPADVMGIGDKLRIAGVPYRVTAVNEDGVVTLEGGGEKLTFEAGRGVATDAGSYKPVERSTEFGPPKQTLAEKAEAAKVEAERLQEKLGRSPLFTGVSPAKAKLLVQWVKAEIEAKVYRYADLVAKFIKNWGREEYEAAAPLLQREWEKARASNPAMGPAIEEAEEAVRATEIPKRPAPTPAAELPPSPLEPGEVDPRANPLYAPEARAMVDLLRADVQTRLSIKDADEIAAGEAIVAANYDAVRESVYQGDLLEKYREGARETVAVRRVLDTEAVESLRTNDPDRLARAMRGTLLYDQSGSELSAAMRARRDQVLKPGEREAVTAARLLNDPPINVRLELAKAERQAAQARERAEKAAKFVASRTAEAPPPRPSRAARKTEAAKAELSAAWAEFTARVGGTLSMNPVDVLASMKRIAKAAMDVGVSTFQEFFSQAVERLGREVAEGMRTVMERAWDETRRQRPRRERRRIAPARAMPVPLAGTPFRTGMQPQLGGGIGEAVRGPAPEPGAPFRTGLPRGLRPPEAPEPAEPPGRAGPQRPVMDVLQPSPEPAAEPGARGRQRDVAGMNQTKPILRDWAEAAIAEKAWLKKQGWDVDGILAGTADPIHAQEFLTTLTAHRNTWGNAFYQAMREGLLANTMTLIRNMTSVPNVGVNYSIGRLVDATVDSFARTIGLRTGGARFGEIGAAWKGMTQAWADAMAGAIISWRIERPSAQTYFRSAGGATVEAELRENVAAFTQEKGRPPTKRELGKLRYWTMVRHTGIVEGDAAWLEAEGHQPAISKEAWQGLLGKRLGKAVRTLQRSGMGLTGAFDQFVKIAVGRGEAMANAARQAIEEDLTGQKKADRIVELMRDPAFWEKAHASEAAAHLTYNDPGGEIVKGIRHLLNAKIGGTKISVDGKETKVGGVSPQRWLVYFLSTGSNLGKEFLRHYPGTSWANVALKLENHLKTRDWETSGLTPAIRKAFLGWATVFILAALRGKDPDKQWITGRRNKAHPYAVKLGDKWMSYQYVQPFSSGLGAIVDLLDALNTGTPWDVATETHRSIMEQVDMWPLFQGVGDLLKAVEYSIRDPETGKEQILRFASNWLASLTSMVPGMQLFKQISRAANAEKPERNAWAHGDEFIRNLALRTVQKTEFPQAFGFLPDEPKIDYQGRKVPKDGSFVPSPATDFLFRMVVPFQVQKAPATVIDRIINNWNMVNDDPAKDWSPMPRARSIERDGVRVYLSPEQYLDYAELAGKKFTDMVTANLQARERARRPVDPAKPTESEFMAVKAIYEEAGEWARGQIIRKYGLFTKAG